MYKAMIMAAGVGSRLEPLTLNVPKPLVPIANKPVMDILLERLSDVNIKSVIANTYYLAPLIIDRYKDNDILDFNYIFEEELSGTAGGLKKCQDFFEEGEDFFVFSGDGLHNADLKKAMKIHKQSGAIATIGVKPVEKSEVVHFGVVVTDKKGFIKEFQEKPALECAKSNLINTGIYVFNYKIFDYIPENKVYDFARNVFPALLKEHKINTFEVNEYWSDIGTLEQYKQSNMDVFNNLYKINHSPIVKTVSGDYISNTRELDESIRFVGKNVIGKNCVIGKNVVIENSVLWDNILIADNVRVVNSVIASNCKILSDVSDKILGQDEVVEDYIYQ